MVKINCLHINFCVAINPCGENDCEQLCANIDGSPVCSCNTGYVLAKDEKLCDGNYFIDN